MRRGGSQNAAVQRGGLWSVGKSVSHRVCCVGGGVAWEGLGGWEGMKKTMKNQRKPPTLPDTLY